MGDFTCHFCDEGALIFLELLLGVFVWMLLQCLQHLWLVLWVLLVVLVAIFVNGGSIVDGFEMGGCLCQWSRKVLPLLHKMVLERLFPYCFEKAV